MGSGIGARIIATGVVWWLAGASAAHGQTNPAAREHLARGIALYEDREFERAIAEFLAGHALDPVPEFVFALAQAERRSGDCESALIYYQRFLATGPPAEQVRAASMHIRRCRAALASGPGVTLREQRPLPAPPAGEETGEGGSAPGLPPWYRDAASDVLLGTSVASAVIGAGFLVSSQSARGHADRAPSHPEADALLSRARRHRRWGVVALGVGGALLGAFSHRVYTRGKRHRERTRSITAAPTRGGFALGYAGRF